MEGYYDTVGRSTTAGMFLGAGAACFATNADCWWWMSILGGLLLVRELWTAE